MRPDMVVLFEPLIDDGLCLSCSCKPFGVKNFTTQCAVEAFVIPVLPRRSWIDIDRLYADFVKPVLEGSGCKLRCVACRERSVFCRLWPPV
jgi:hypothetical protein